MSRTPTILVIIVAGFIAAWGCGQSPSSGRSLEARVAKLEQELKASEAARDAARAQAVAAEQKLKQEQAKATTIEKELRNSLQARTAERDQALAQFEGFRKNLKDLLGQVEAAAATLPSATQPTSASAVTGSKGF